MEQTKVIARINRGKLLDGICQILTEKRKEQYAEVAARVEREMQLDERILVLEALIEVHPFLQAELLDVRRKLIFNAEVEATKDLPPTYIGYAEKEILRARLELMKDEELQAYTLEELASLLRD